MFIPPFQFDRKQLFKRLAYSLVFFVVCCWLAYFVGESRDSAKTWKTMTLDSSFVMVAIVLSVIYFAISVCLFRGQEWAWWAAMFFVEIPVFVVVLIWLPSPFAFFAAIALSNALSALIATAPRLSDFLPSKVDSNLDETAHLLGLHWYDNPVWNMVQLAKEGEVGKAAGQYRDLHYLTWDQAEQAIKKFMISELELKTHLLREHVELLHQAQGHP